MLANRNTEKREQSYREYAFEILYCHDNEHQRQLEAAGSSGNTHDARNGATHSPFANLKSLLADRKR